MDKKAYVRRESRRAPSGHICHAEGCHAAVAPAFFMCAKHWRMVPYGLRLEVWRLFQPGQEITKDASAEYIRAARAAIEAVALKEH